MGEVCKDRVDESDPKEGRPYGHGHEQALLPWNDPGHAQRQNNKHADYGNPKNNEDDDASLALCGNTEIGIRDIHFYPTDDGQNHPRNSPEINYPKYEKRN